MSNFEDRITEDSTEFEKEFLKIYDGNLWTALDKMKDWQPPKPLKFVNDSREKPLGVDFFSVGDLSRYPQVWDKVLLSALVDGYTVEKEQLYYLKNKITNQYINMNPYNGHCHESMIFGDCYKCVFTQEEIDKLNIGSYEQIEVKVEEVEK